VPLTESYNYILVVISVLAAIGSSFVALSTVPRIHSSTSRGRSLAWVVAFGFSLGAGIWTMHFIALLALQLPIPVQYDLELTVFSLILAIIVSAAAISPLRGGGSLRMFKAKTMMIGTVMGFGIAGMHYAGMVAMRLNAVMHHHSYIIALAVAIAIVASTAALLIANQLRDTRIFAQPLTKSIAAIVMGIAVSAMHYTAMYGMAFHPSASQVEFVHTVDPLILAVFIITVAFLIQGGIIISALFDEAYSISRNATDAMKKRADINKALSDILAVSMNKQPLDQMMSRVLDIILAIEWLTFEKKGSIFIADNKTKILNMVAQQNLQPELLKRCGKLAFGTCLCGAAAATQKLVYKSCIDHEHSIRPEQMSPHGHYCVPVIAQGEVLAVINLYLDHQHRQTEEEVEFLVMVADALAPMIQNHALEAQALKIYSAIDQAGEAVLISDQTGVIEYVNRAFIDITGYSFEESIGQKPSILKSGEQDHAFYKKMWDTITAGEVWQGEVMEKRKNGNFYPAMLTISPIRNSSGEITSYVGIHEDLSEHKSLEAQFRQAQKMEALGTLVGGIAHDFNNMLAGMIGNLFLIKRKMTGNAEILEKVERIESVGFQAAEMIKQMLIFARNEGIQMQQLAFGSFIKEAFKLHQVAIPESVNINKQLSDLPLYISGDPTQLQQLVLNLFGNAVDAVRESDHPMITVKLDTLTTSEAFTSTHPDTNAGNYVHLSVSDNGHGINPEHIERIFDPFFTTKEVGKGTGLGLSMSASIVKSHHGYIDVESQPGQGSTFHVYFPMVEHKEVHHTTPADIERFSAKGELILVVDDDETLRSTTAEALASIGYRTLTAGNGLEAVEIYSSIKVDLIILDVVMPEMGGPAAAKIMLQNNPATRIIFASGYDKESALRNTDGLENVPLLSKPFEITELQKTIRILLD